MTYEWNIMWLDCVLILPLLGLGVRRIWHNRTIGMYTFSLAYALLTSFYIGYMLCIASLVFFIAFAAAEKRNKENTIQTFGKFALGSCIGGFAVAFAWIPAFIYLRTGRDRFGGMDFTTRFDLAEFTSKFVAGSSDGQELVLGLPHVFCGTLVLFLVLVFFFNGKFSLRKRITVLAVTVLFVLSFYVRALDMVWHGFSENNCFNHRYSFIFSYVLIMTAQYTMEHRNQITGKAITASAGVLLALFGYVYLMKYSHVWLEGVYISVGVLVISFLCFNGTKLSRNAVTTILVMASLLEMGANCYMTWEKIVGDGDTLYLYDYEDSIWGTKPAVGYVKAQDSGFYRMEKTFLRSKNDAMFYNYNGLSHFSSTEQTSVLEFLQKMGFTKCNDYWTYYNTGSTAAVDSLLGVKYVLSKTDISASKGYELIHTVNDIGIYQNPNVLPIAMLADTDIQKVSMEKQDYFALHNAIWSGICGEKTNIHHQAVVDSVTTVNLIQTVNADGSILYTKMDKELPASICYGISITSSDPLYYYFVAPGEQNANIIVNGEDRGLHFHSVCWAISQAGNYSVGEQVKIEVVLNDNQITISQPCFYYEDMTSLSEVTEAIKEKPVQLVKQSSSHLTGEFVAEKDQLLLFTIPYDESWRVYVDGERADLIQVMDALLAVRVPSGTHNFEIRFVPKGIAVGCVLSLLSVAAMALYYGKKAIKRKHN